MQTKEKPILFSGPMVRAILEGRKTQTRRVVKPMPSQHRWLDGERLNTSPRARPVMIDGEQWGQFAHPHAGKTVGGIHVGKWSPYACIKCPYGQPGDRLWVRETWQPLWKDADCPGDWETGDGFYVNYPATDGIAEWHDEDRGLTLACRPSIHMPRWASRLTLEVTGVRVERLQDISEEDAKAEGFSGPVDYPGNSSPHWWKGLSAVHVRDCWDSMNAKHPWESNPWVWVVEFRPISS